MDESAFALPGDAPNVRLSGVVICGPVYLGRQPHFGLPSTPDDDKSRDDHRDTSGNSVGMPINSI
jgi:hypothetical protein